MFVLSPQKSTVPHYGLKQEGGSGKPRLIGDRPILIFLQGQFAQNPKSETSSFKPF